MTEETKKLEISQDEMELIASALETQTKILRMQASAGGHGAKKRLEEVRRVLATVTRQNSNTNSARTQQSGFWGLLRSMGEAT